MAAESDHLTLYEAAGVNYRDMDPFKLTCMRAGAATAKNIERFAEFGLELREDPHSRGESAHSIEFNVTRPVRYTESGVVEGIGSKNMISQQIRDGIDYARFSEEAMKALGRSFHRGAGWDNLATAVNDVSSSGASPYRYMMFAAAGDSKWFKDEERREDLAGGIVDGCNVARVLWGGGESQTLVGMVDPGLVVLAGYSSGLRFPDHVRYPSERNLKPGLKIIVVEVPGPQTNGLTYFRTDGLDKVAKAYNIPHEKRLDAYGVDIGNGQTYGEAVLTPSVIFSPLVDRLLLDPDPTPIEYISHISGHGWSKIMRGQTDLTYVIDKIPAPPPVFPFIQELSGMPDEEAYRTFGMGGGYALFVEEQYAPRVMQVSRDMGFSPLDAGVTEEGPKRVVIKPIGVTYEEDALQIR